MEIIDETSGAQNTASSWELENKDILEEFQNSITGKNFILDADGNAKMETHPEFALVNEIGGRFLVSRMALLVNRWTALTLADDDQVRKFSLYFGDALRKELRVKKDEFGLKLYNFESLILMASEFVYLALCKSLKEGERNYRKGIERRVYSIAGKNMKEAFTGLFGIGRNQNQNPYAR